MRIAILKVSRQASHLNFILYLNGNKAFAEEKPLVVNS